MLLIKKKPEIRSSEITDRELFRQRRRFIRSVAVTAASAPMLQAFLQPGQVHAASTPLENVRKSGYGAGLQPTPYEYVTTYNNFYEFGTDKEDPAKRAGKMKTRPWDIAVEGECDKPGTYGVDDFINPHALEESIYRFRCVEAWSMVVPWVGIPLTDVLKRFEPNSRAKYVAFETLYDPEQMPGQKSGFFSGGLEWPYREGLRMDEAIHPLSIFAVGVYGEVLPNQNGAPLRLIVPWKYGFKSIKSIVTIRFTEQEPQATWNQTNPREYGFYSNVNPEVDHPRWSQKYERRLGEGSWFAPKHKTLMFNGYAEEVANLYAGMDLSKYY